MPFLVSQTIIFQNTYINFQESANNDERAHKMC